MSDDWARRLARWSLLHTRYCRPRRSSRGALAEPGVRIEGAVQMSEGVRLLRGATLLGHGGGEGITLGPRAIVARWAVVESLGGFVRIGQDSGVGDFSNLYGQGGLTIGDGVLVASGVRVLTEEHGTVGDTPVRDQAARREPTTIHDGAWLGANVVVLAGVTVGSGAVCAAGSVVTHDVEPMYIVAGVPARAVRRR